MWALWFAKLLRKPSVLVIGGYDLANLPIADYGQQRGGLGKWISRVAMKLASALFTNSAYSQIEAERNAGVSKDRVKVIYHGITDPFTGLPQISKEQMVLTVGNVDSANVKRKGLEPFVRAASYLPEMEFVLVGAWKDNTIEYLQSIATSNVLFTGRVSDKELMDYYRKASVYVQASLHEGFGMSVAESMLAGCIPVVTRAGALPEVVGDTGVYTDSTEPAEIAQAIEIAIKFSTDQRDQARQRVLKMFTLEKRRQLLENLVQLTIGDNDGA
jgi:glycosyltransferase involved in cell wall biosynthesis